MTQRAADGDVVVAVALAFDCEAAAKIMEVVDSIEPGGLLNASQDGACAAGCKRITFVCQPQGIGQADIIQAREVFSQQLFAFFADEDLTEFVAFSMSDGELIPVQPRSRDRSGWRGPRPRQR